MERYLTLLIVVALLGLAIQRRNQREGNLSSSPKRETKTIAPLATFETDAEYPLILTSYTGFTTPTAIIYQKRNDDTAVCKNSIQQLIKNCRWTANQAPSEVFPGPLFYILQSMRLSEP